MVFVGVFLLLLRMYAFHRFLLILLWFLGGGNWQPDWKLTIRSGGGVFARVVFNSSARGIKKAGKFHGKTTPKTLSKFEAFSGGFFVGIWLRILTLGASDSG